MKKTWNHISLVIGFILLLGGLLLYGLNRFEFVNLENAKLSVVVMIFGIGLLISGACELFIKPSKEMQIEAKDERNIAIGRHAKSFAFDIMTCLLSVVMVILILFNYISMGAFFTLFGVYVISQIAFIYRLWYLQKIM